MAGVLYVVATPIGNLEDITLRALRVLKEASLIAAEDTRHTRKLLAHYGLSTPLTSYHEHIEREKSPYLIEKLKEGMDIALVSDAGTPGISDPGYRLIKLAVENSIRVVSIPGPSALISVLSVSGMPIDEFTFKGFVPSGESQRRKFLLECKTPDRTFAMYEAPSRIKDTLSAIMEVLGDVGVILAREMTKVHEEILRGKASEVLSAFDGREAKGEITLVVRTGKITEGVKTPAEEIEGLLRSGFKLNDVVKAVAGEFGLPRSEVYKEALRIKEKLREQEV